MTDYVPPLDDIEFALQHVAGLSEIAGFDGFGHADPESVSAILAEYGRFVATEVAPTNRIGDVEGSRFSDGDVITPEVFRSAYRGFTAAGWGAVPFEEEIGGGGFPWVVGVAMQEMLSGANLAFSMAPFLTQGSIDAIRAHGDDALRSTYLERLVSGEWAGTMNLTEPDAGSDVGNVRTRAVAAEDGTYRITGTKIFISYGEQDLTDNIVHLVLARLPDASPGTRGISCFVVPKFLVDPDGTPGARNDVRCVSIEHKLGINASPTCVLDFGSESDGAVGWLLGEREGGMRTMFTMMNNARLSVGTSGLAVASLAYQKAAVYARERLQGRAVGAAPGTRSPIIEHPDVRRMLLLLKVRIEAIRALCYFDASHIDRSRHHPDPAQRAASADLVAFLTPLCKSGGTDLAFDAGSVAVQIHGGMGYIEETGVAQCLRDAKITQIYEGTNGIQAIDLVTRKLPMGRGAVFADLLGRIRSTVDDLAALGVPGDAIAKRLADAVDTVEASGRWLGERLGENVDDALAGATPFQSMCVTLVGGWLLAVEAIAAHGLEGSSDRAAARIAMARFYADAVLPTVTGEAEAVRVGSTELFAVPESAY